MQHPLIKLLGDLSKFLPDMRQEYQNVSEKFNLIDYWRKEMYSIREIIDDKEGVLEE
jgi:hypothetical protein